MPDAAIKPARPHVFGSLTPWRACLTAISFLSCGALADSPPATASPVEPAGTELESIIVEGQRERLERQIRTFATSILLPRYGESLARWQVPICPFVAGLTPGQGEFVRKRVSQIVRDSGAPLAPEKCKTNFVIIMTPEPAVFLRAWGKQNPKFFHDGRGRGDVELVIRTAKPIRVWHNVQSKCPNGRSTFAVQGGEDDSTDVSYIHCSDGSMGSKLRWVTVRKIVAAIVVADSTLIEGRTIGQLADYVAIIGLAQLRRNAEPGTAPTILRLFSEEPNGPQRLTRWDEAFLKSVYATDPESVLQLSRVLAGMYEDLAR
jgi:hypothetical protein